jgi:AsmA protein
VKLKANSLDTTAQISGGLSIAQLDLAKFLDSIGHPLPPMAPGSLSKVELVSRLSGTPTSVTFDDLNLKVDDSTFTGRIAVEDFAKQALRMQLKGDTFDADRYLPRQIRRSHQRHRRTPGRSARQRSQRTGRLRVTRPLPDAPTKVAGAPPS